MARIVFIDLVKSASGKYCTHSNIVFNHKKNGTNYTSVMCNPRTSEPSSTEVALRNKFKQAQARVKVIMNDAEQLEDYTTGFKAQHKYSTLRGYIFSEVYKLIP